MYLENFSNHQNNQKNEEKIDRFYREGQISVEGDEAESERKKELTRREKILAQAIFRWQALEFESDFRKEPRWYFYLSLVLLAIIGYAIYTNSPVMAITFILIGLLGYIYLHKEPEVLDFAIIEDGLLAGREIYKFENIYSFWIFYEPGEKKVISLHTKSSFIPFVHIPIGDKDPVTLRKILLDFIPETKQDLRFIDHLERIIGI